MQNIIHFIIPKTPNTQQLNCIQTAKNLNAASEIRIWHDDETEDDFLLKDYLHKANCGAQRADLLRLDIIYKYGGIYLDSDMLSVKALDDLYELSVFFCSENGRDLSNGAFGATKNHPLIKTLISYLIENEPDWTLPPNETTGPRLFTNALKWNREIYLLPRDTFYPYIGKENISPPLPSTVAIHLWAGSWIKEESENKSDLRLAFRKKYIQQKYKIKKNLASRIKKLILYAERALSLTEKQRPRAASYAFGSDQIALTKRGFFLALPGKDLSLTPTLSLKGLYEEREFNFLEKHLKGGDWFVDVGCNIGVFSILAASLVGSFGRVYSFDANPEVLNYLKRSAVLNWMHERISVENKAIGQEACTKTLSYSELRLGEGTLGLDNDSPYARTIELLGHEKHLEINQSTIDAEFKGNFEIKILKLDIEGHEYGAILGAKRLIESRSIAYIMIEFIEEISSSLSQKNQSAIKFVLDHGYSLAEINEDGSLNPIKSLINKRRDSNNIVLCRN